MASHGMVANASKTVYVFVPHTRNFGGDSSLTVGEEKIMASKSGKL